MMEERDEKLYTFVEKPEEMDYATARDLIVDGDTIVIWRLRGNEGMKGIVHAIMEWFTGSPVFHTAQAMWVVTDAGTRRLMAVEANVQSRRIIPLSFYEGFKFEVFPLPRGLPFAPMEEYAMERVATEHYGFFNLITIGAREYLGLPPKSVSGQVCSEFSASCLRRSGVGLPTAFLSPGALRAAMVRAGMRPAIVVNPDLG